MVGQVTHVFSATQAEATSNSAGAATVWVGPSEWNSAHAFAMTMTGSTANVSTVSGTNIILGASQNLTVSGTSNSVYLVGPQLSAYEIGAYGTSNMIAITSLAATSATIFGEMWVLPTEMAVSRLDIYGSVSFLAPTLASSSTSHTGGSSGATTVNVGLWSQQGVGSTGTLTLVSSSQYTMAYTASMSGSSSSQTDNMTVTWNTGTPFASVTGTFTGTSNSTSGAVSSGNSSFFTGNFDLPFVCSATLEPGNYFFGGQFITSNNSGAGPQMSFYFNKLFGNITFAYFGNASKLGIGAEFWQGVAMSLGSSNAMPASFAIGNLSTQTLGQLMCQAANYSTNATWM